MKHEGFYKLFLDELADMHSSEKQIVAALPQLIQSASDSKLKEALTHHLKETKEQLKRIEKIFSLLKMPTQDKTCEAMQGLIKEAHHLIKNKEKSAVLDAAIISAAQKVEHYEIASYGTLISFAKTLSLDGEIPSLLKSTIKEEGAADQKLTKIAEGGFFTGGVNVEAIRESKPKKSKRAPLKKPSASSVKKRPKVSVKKVSPPKKKSAAKKR